MFFLGTLQTSAGATGSLLGVNNRVTGISGARPFSLPRDARLFLSPDTTGMRWALGASAGFQVGATTSLPLGGPDGVNGPYGVVGESSTISVISPLGGTVRVFLGGRA